VFCAAGGSSSVQYHVNYEKSTIEKIFGCLLFLLICAMMKTMFIKVIPLLGFKNESEQKLMQ
jgi:hypothetical protein